jgi:glutamine amidotransferase
VGWNTATPLREHPILKGIRRGVDFYFVHSYCFSVAEPSAILAETEYGVRFASIVGKGNVVGVQFHPEKSQANGVRLLDNFCMWDGKC